MCEMILTCFHSISNKELLMSSQSLLNLAVFCSAYHRATAR